MYLDLSEQTIKSVCEIVATGVLAAMGWMGKRALNYQSKMSSDIYDIKIQLVKNSERHDALERRVTFTENKVMILEEHLIK